MNGCGDESQLIVAASLVVDRKKQLEMSKDRWQLMAFANVGENFSMNPFDRITWNPNQMNGQPSIRGMRITVRRVVEAVVTYPNREDLLRNYPELEPDDIQQALAFAASNLEDMASETTRPDCHREHFDFSLSRVFRAMLPPGSVGLDLPVPMSAKLE